MNANDDLKNLTFQQLIDIYSKVDRSNLLDNASSVGPPRVQGILVYPIKACAPFVAPASWPVGKYGFLYDRQIAIARDGESILNLNTEGRLTDIYPFIDLERKLLIIHSSLSSKKNLIVPLHPLVKGKPVKTKVLGAVVNAEDCGQEAADWLNDLLELDVEYRLFRQVGERANPHPKGEGGLKLSDESHILMLSTGSLDWLHGTIEENTGLVTFETLNICLRLRPNLIVTGVPALAEENWRQFKIGNTFLKAFAGCVRCSCVKRDPYSGSMDTEPLNTIFHIRPETKEFAVHVCVEKFEENDILQVGDVIDVLTTV